jgi:hypothetical protein
VTTSRTLSARIAGFTRHALNGSEELSRKGREAMLARFAAQVDPQNLLSESERLSRALALRRAYMTRLALASAEARAARKR